jgi:hypothetical protein
LALAWRALPATGRLELDTEIGNVGFSLAETACMAACLQRPWDGEQADGLVIVRRRVALGAGAPYDKTEPQVLIGMAALRDAYGCRESVTGALVQRDLRALAAALHHRQPGRDRFPVRSSSGNGAWLCATDGLLVTAYEFKLLS